MNIEIINRPKNGSKNAIKTSGKINVKYIIHMSCIYWLDSLLSLFIRLIYHFWNIKINS